MSGRFAGANDVDELWTRIVAGDDCLTDLDRDELLAEGVPAAVVDDPAYVRRAGLLDDVAGFDHDFFAIGARDAAVMDPQHRHFLECSWAALESAAIVPERFDGAIGVFGGSGMNTYLVNNIITNGRVLDQLGWFLVRHTGNDKDFLTNNVSYRLDLRGPAVNVQTACSTSLVAVHLAIQSLLEFESDLALAGGVTINVPHHRGYEFREGEILAPDGRCRAFDAESAGTVITSGVAIVALRRLGDALADGDPVLAVIRGSAVNNDGARKVGFLAPSVDAHAEVIREALSVADLSARDIQLFEGHGTGTAVGDPIEVAAATAAYRSWTDDAGFCRLGSTKPNIGHTDTAAGAASLIKVVQALSHHTLPPLANHTGASPLLDLDRSPFTVSGSAEPWPGDHTRRAGISSLGVGGTNAHVIVEEAPTPESVPRSDPEQLLVLSAMQPEAVAEGAARLADHLEAHPDLDLRQVAHTLQAGRRAMPHRRVVAATDLETAVRALRGEDRLRSAQGLAPVDAEVRLGFMFPGGGSQYPGMAAGLDGRFDTFHRVREEGIELVRQAGGVDLAPLLVPDADPSELRPPTASLPAVFVTSVALARQWMTFGATPDLLLGHSLGEYVAAHLAGVMSYSDVVRLVVVRSTLMQRASGDDAAMLVVPLSEHRVLDMLPPALSLAVVNADEECVVAGRLDAIEPFADALEAAGTPGSLIPLAAAAHSALLDPVLDEFEETVRQVRLDAPTLPYLSNLSGTWVTPEQATDARYWVDHLRGTVRFADCLRTAVEGSPLVLSELGPGQALSSIARRAQPGPHDACPSLRHPSQDIDDTAYTLQAYARLWAAGADVDLGPLTESTAPRLRLPTYAFQHEHCWIDAGVPIAHGDPAGELAPTGPPVRIDDLDQATWTVDWQPADGPAPAAEAGAWLVSGDEADPLVAELVAELGARAGSCVSIGRHVPEHVDDLAGVVVVAPSDAVSYTDTERRWFDDAPKAVRLLGAASGDTRFVAVTRAALPARGVAERPADAMALGMALVADREYPTISGRLVDIDTGTSVSDLVAEALGADSQVVALRDGVRYTADLRRQTVPAPSDGTPTFRPEGTYVVTGGLGGIGHALAVHLAATHRANLVLISSTPIPLGEERQRWLAVHAHDDPTSRRIRHLHEVEQHGTKVEVVEADMSDPASIRSALDEAERRVGPLDGALHAAGVVRDVLIELATHGDHTAVLGPKAHGALVLADELAARGAELLVLISSTSTTLAPAGQASYVGANSVLDALAGRRDGLRIATVDYGLWADVGIASDMARRARLGIVDTEPIDHPVFGERHALPDGSTAFVGRVDASCSWVVDEHRTADGVAVYPGAGHVHLMMSAAEQLLGPVTLTDVSLLSPLVVRDDTPVTVRAVVAPDGSVAVHSDEGTGDGWELRSQGTVNAVDRPPRRPAPGSLEFDGEPIADLLGAQREHMQFGSRWESTVEGRRGEGVVVGRLRLPTGDDEATRWNPHPALFDLATAAGIAVVADPDGAPGLYVPTGYGAIRTSGKVPADLVVCANRSEESIPDRVAVDVIAIDDAGRAVLEIERLELLRSDGHAVLQVDLDRERTATVEGTLADLADALGVRPHEGAELIERLLASDHDRIVGSTIDIADLAARVADPDGHDDHDGADDAAAATSLEAAMASIWCDLLGDDTIGPDDDFFDLGGHSLIAIRLMARIHTEVGVRLQLAAIFEAPTIALLCAHLRAEQPDVDQLFAAERPDAETDTSAKEADRRGPAAATAPARTTRPARRLLVPISTSGDKTPLHVVHGAGGNVLFLGSFGRALGDRPVFGFQAHGVNAGEVPDDTVDRMARRYVAELRSHGPGPYLLGGYSGGGAIALEMANLLQRDEDRVGGVVLFDSPVGRISLGRRVHALHLLRNIIRHGPGPAIPIVRSRLQDSDLGRRLDFRGRTSTELESHEANYADMRAHGFNDLYDHFTQVSEQFEVGEYDVDAVLVKAQLRWPLMSEDYGWSEHIRGRLDVVIAAGDHESMFHADNAPGLAADLAPLLDRYDESLS
ncbi:MAG: KR domain-containing protein [Ilumatobacter sp.]|nr:KR domain-containing protein [Ilumatobacter sp.]